VPNFFVGVKLLVKREVKISFDRPFSDAINPEKILPFENFSDKEIWEALEYVDLKKYVSAFQNKLNEKNTRNYFTHYRTIFNKYSKGSIR